MKDPRLSLIWITDILHNLKIPFQIAGGLAAIAYGSKRPLQDIDIDIPESAFDSIKQRVSPYIDYGPASFQDEAWNFMLMTLNYNGQVIDLSGALQAKMRCKETGEWQNISTDFSKVTMKEIYGLVLPVIPYDDLLYYKTMIGREVDLLDIKEIASYK